MSPNYEIDIMVRGRPVQKYHKDGMTFVEGRKNSNFELRIRNNTWNNIELVATVDGLSVIDGKPGGPSDQGYIVHARGEIIIPGWRLDNDSVAEFIFCDKSKSYVSQMGHNSGNSGVIGFMIFEEETVKKFHAGPAVPRTPTWPDIPKWPNEPWIMHDANATRRVNLDHTNNAPVFGSSNISASAMSVSDSVSAEASMYSMGTGWGDQIDHRVSHVEFQRKDPVNPAEIVSIYYDSRKGLESRGIQVVKPYQKETAQLPNPFPEYVSGATPPPGWKPKRKRG